MLHVGGGWLAFAAGPVALLTVKGSHRHIWAGRVFAVSMTAGIAAGIALAALGPVVGLLCFGGLMVFLLGTGFMAPRIGQGSARWYLGDRVLTGLGGVASIGLLATDIRATSVPWSDVAFAALGLWIVVAHATWRGPPEASRWPIHHLTSFIAAYAVAWNFILALYLRSLPPTARLLVPLAATVGIGWARYRFADVSFVRRGPVSAPSGAA